MPESAHKLGGQQCTEGGLDTRSGQTLIDIPAMQPHVAGQRVQVCILHGAVTHGQANKGSGLPRQPDT